MTRAVAMPWTPPPRRTVVVAPHPDDESLAAGGLIAAQRARGTEVVVVAVTDGEASYDPSGDRSLGARRRREQWEALNELGVADGPTHRLGLPDSRVAEFEADIHDRLVEILSPGDLLVAPWPRDAHPDHEACGRAARRAVRPIEVSLVWWLFWAWHERRIGEIDCRCLLSLELSTWDHAAKQRAIRRHTSQFVPDDGESTPVLDERVVEPAAWSHEYFLAAPGPPEPGEGE